MARRLLSKEQDAYLREISFGRSAELCAEMLNEKFGLKLKKSQIRYYRKNHNIRAGLVPWNYRSSNGQRIFSDEIEDFIKENCLNRSGTELTNMVNEKFGTNYKVQQITSFKKRKGLSSGLSTRFKKGCIPFSKGKKQIEYMSQEAIQKTIQTRFKKGNIPHNTRPIGAEKLTKDGYTLVKINDKPKGKKNENWILKERLIWEKKHGKKLPEDYRIVFLDGNKKNFDPDNLEAITIVEHGWLNRNGLRYKNAEATRIAVKLARQESKMNKIKKTRKEQKNDR